MLCANPQSRFPTANKTIALIRTTFLPNTSLSLPYKICMLVFAMRNEVPTQDTSLAALNSLAILGSAVDTEVWSKNESNKEIANPKNTINSCFKGNLDVWSWIDNFERNLSICSPPTVSATPSTTSTAHPLSGGSACATILWSGVGRPRVLGHIYWDDGDLSGAAFERVGSGKGDRLVTNYCELRRLTRPWQLPWRWKVMSQL